MRIMKDLNAFSELLKTLENLEKLQDVASYNNIAIDKRVNMFVFAGFNNEEMIRTNMSFSGMMELFMNTITSIMKQGKMDVSDYPKVEKELMYYFHRALESEAE